MSLRELLAKLGVLEEEVRTLLETDVKAAEAKMEEIRSLDKQIKLLQEIEARKAAEAGEGLEGKEGEEGETRTVNIEELEERAVKKVILGKKLDEEERSVINSTDNSALLPEGFIRQIEDIKQGYGPLKSYTHVISVGTLTGKMPVNLGTETRGLANLATDDEIVQEMINTEEINYDVNEYAKIIPVRNATLEDAGVSIKDLITGEFVENAVFTENEKIVGAVDKVAKAVTAKDDIELVKHINLMSPIARARGVILVNPLGFDYLDNLRDADGRPMLRELSQGGGFVFKGIKVEEVEQDIIKGTKPVIYVADLHKSVKFFDRKGVEIAVDKSAGFTKNRTLFRVIQRHDIKEGHLGKVPEKFAIKVTVEAATETK